MITIAEAKSKLEEHVKRGHPARLLLSDATGLVLAEGVAAGHDSPPFDRSAMDGFAVKSADVGAGCSLPISQVVRAGACPRPLDPGTCAKIMTGAMIPAEADAVIPQEEVDADGGAARFRTGVRAGAFIRRRGEELKAGELLLCAGAFLTPAAIALLASQGIAEIAVSPAPRVAILTTGDEVARPGEELPSAKIYDANTAAIAASFSRSIPAAMVDDLGIIGDDLPALKQHIARGLERDLFLVSGGVSVGEFDHVRAALQELGVRELFWRVAQKPGKPLSMGIAKSGAVVFGLPGNPAAVLVCMTEYVLPAARRMMGMREIWPRRIVAELSEPIDWERDRVEFVRGRLQRAETPCVAPIRQDESYMLKGFADADALIVTERPGRYLAGERVEVHLL